MSIERLCERLVGTTISSPRSDYEVEDVLGSGGFGALLQCRKKLTNETVALKVIKKSVSMEFAKQEVKTLETLNAAGSKDFHIVTLNDAFIFKGRYCLEFKKLDLNLCDYMDENEFSLKEIRPILHQLVKILIFLESKEIIHSDVKPENIMMVDHLHQPLKIELIDFGCAVTSSQTLESICGTMFYMAPEMLVKAPYNHSVDMWALGCVAAEMLTGSRLFEGKSNYDVLRRILNTIGMPPGHVLSAGFDKKRYFHKERRKNQSHIWTLKSPWEVRSEECSPFQERSLDEILNVSETAEEDGEDGEALERDREAFVDLVTKMLHIDPAQRITPAEVMEHPFLTLSHLDPNHYHNYVKLSTELMEVCDIKKLEGESFPRCSATSDSSASISSEES